MNTSLRHRLLIGLLALSFVGLARGQATQPAPKFLRFVPDAVGGGVLQTSIVTYRNNTGRTVDLIGAVHVADASYFQELNQTFTTYDSLLYELVKPKDFVPGRGPRLGAEGERPMEMVGMLQMMLKNMLELSFQLDEIDYTKPNMVHADLDSDTFMQMQAERGESLLTLMLQQMLREMSRQQANPQVEVLDVAGLLMAMQAPDRARQFKLVLARQFNQMEDMMSGIGGPNGTVILTERNRAALTVLRKRLEAGDRKIGIFYGAAHLSEMEKDLTGLMGFRQVGEPKWVKAWDMASAPGSGAARPATRPAIRPAPSPAAR